MYGYITYKLGQIFAHKLHARLLKVEVADIIDDLTFAEGAAVAHKGAESPVHYLQRNDGIYVLKLGLEYLVVCIPVPVTQMLADKDLGNCLLYTSPSPRD